MEHIDFVIWMLGYPLLVATIKVLEIIYLKKTESDDIATVINFMIWILVACLLF